MASKKELAIALYAEMEAKGTLTRKAFIETAQAAPLNMTAAGASTYYSTCKSIAEGKAPKTYYKPASARVGGSTATTKSKAVDDSKQDADLYTIVIVENNKVEQAHSFMSSEGAIERYNKLVPKNKARAKVVAGAPDHGADVSTLNVIHG